jgi:hypothetical protein
MRSFLLLSWLALPVAGVAYHYGPGQDRLVLDEVARLVASAESAAADSDWADAVKSYGEAIGKLPGDRVGEARHLRLERAKAQMNANELPTAARDLQSLVEEFDRDPATSPELRAESRRALANSQFYMTWLLRLEGKTRAEWEPQIEAARQNYRLLAEAAEGSGDAKAQDDTREDLEAAIRLERLELEDLQGLPLPSQ